MTNLLFRSELAKKKFYRFKKNRWAWLSVWILAVLVFLGLTAEFWANSKPLVLHYQGQTYFPVINRYHPSVFGRQDIFQMDYRSLSLKEGDWQIWPLVKWDPFESDSSLESYPSAPTKDHWFGTDDRGRDVLARLLYGLRYTFIYSLSVWALSYLIGCFWGALMGFRGGAWDLWGSRVVEVIEMTPSLLLLITVVSIFEPSLLLLILFGALLDWTAIFHQVRAQFLQLRKREFVESARASGASETRILFRHILPNALTPIVTFSPFAIAGNISLLTVLDYLGLGLRAPTPSWGELLGQAQKYFTYAEWLVWFPCGALLLVMVALINVGLGFRDAFDSRLNP